MNTHKIEDKRKKLIKSKLTHHEEVHEGIENVGEALLGEPKLIFAQRSGGQQRDALDRPLVNIVVGENVSDDSVGDLEQRIW